MIAEPARLRARGAPLLSKFGNPSIREILAVTSAYVPRPYRLWGRGRGVPNIPTGEGGMENAIFSWRETGRCFWATGIFLGGKSHDHRRF